MSNFTTTHMIVAMLLCLLLLGGFSPRLKLLQVGILVNGEVATIDAIGHGCSTIIGGRCVDQDCTTLCRSEKYSGGIHEPNDIR
ncbi:hypothetical protein MKX01_017531 [Papaver californicum]|nr:hypothetical protein MKX01_017531 [Papaver californicum]